VAAKLIDRIAAEVGPPEVLVTTIGAFGPGDALSTTPQEAAMLTSLSYSAMVARPKCNLNWRVALSGVVSSSALSQHRGGLRRSPARKQNAAMSMPSAGSSTFIAPGKDWTARASPARSPRSSLTSAGASTRLLAAAISPIRFRWR
jgi:hypothetical protein